MFSARPSFRLAPSAWMTLATPAIWAAACAAAPAFSPATSTCTSPPQARAAVTVLSVALLMEALSCSAITRDVMSLSSLDHFGFVLELGHQRGNVRHLDTGAALGGLGHLERLQARGDIDAQLFRLDGVQLLFLGLHDVGQRDVARLVQAQIGGDDGRQAQGQGFQAAVHFTDRKSVV